MRRASARAVVNVQYDDGLMVSSGMDTTMKKYYPACSRLILAVLAGALAGVCGCTMSDSCHECSVDNVMLLEGTCMLCQYNENNCLTWTEQESLNKCNSLMEDGECRAGTKECDDKKKVYKVCEFSVEENKFVWEDDKKAYNTQCMKCKTEHECDEKDKPQCDSKLKS